MLTLGFAAFAVVTLVAFHLLPLAARKGWLLLGSYVFYAAIAWQFIPVLLALSLATHALAARIRLPDGSVRAWPLWAGVALNVAALVGLRWVYPLTPFAAPFAVVGLSFYTLQAISYLADLYTGTAKSRAALPELCLYLAYFPKLIAGPLERSGPFIAKLNASLPVDDAMVGRAFTLIVVGVGRKVLIADPLRALILPAAFTAPDKLGALMLAASIFAFAVILYNDFAGYTAMARGVSLLFGIELSPNFKRPFFATSFTDFWNRWHITLSLWLRDYVYLPLSRRLLRRNPSLWNVPNLILPPLLTMLVSGFWHGGSAHMLVWGGLHGVLLIVERLLTLLSRRRAASSIARQVATATLVAAVGTGVFVFFRMDMPVAVAFWRRLLSGAPGPWPDARWLLFILPSFGLDFLQARHGDENIFDHWPRFVRAVLLAAALLLWFHFSRDTPPAPFIYRGF